MSKHIFQTQKGGDVMLNVEHLTCGYGGSPVVRDVSFRVREGERLCILGPNG